MGNPKDKERKIEKIEASHTLGGAGESRVEGRGKCRGEGRGEGAHATLLSDAL